MAEKIENKILGLAFIVSFILVLAPVAGNFFTAEISNVSVYVPGVEESQTGPGGGGYYPPVPTSTPPEKKPIPPAINPSVQPEKNILPEKTPTPSTPAIISLLPMAVADLTQKIPDFSRILSKLNISSAEDIVKLQNYNIFLPGLKELTGASFASLTQEQKNKIPAETMFVLLGDGKIDALTKLDFSDAGVVKQKINVFSGESLRLILKPKPGAKTVSGYMLFKTPATKIAFTGKYIPSFNVALSALSSAGVSSNYVPKSGVALLPQNDQQFVILNFNYNDDDKDGIYVADIKAPVVKGEYEVVSSIDYGGQVAEKKDIKFTTLVDPEGYIYERTGDKELRINNATVSLYKLNEAGGYELWNAGEFGQENPQITDATGNYAFLVPAGTYYITVSAPNYYLFQGDAFSVAEGKEIHANIALKKEFDVLALFNWNTILIIILFCLVAYNFFRDAKKSKNNL